MYFHNKIQLFFCCILFDNVFAKNLRQLIHARIKKSYLFLSAWNQKLIQEKWAVGYFLLGKKYFTPWLQDKKKIFFSFILRCNYGNFAGSRKKFFILINKKLSLFKDAVTMKRKLFNNLNTLCWNCYCLKGFEWKK